MIKSKLLSDAGWKDIATKSRVKDNGLLKTLEKLKRLGDDDHDETTRVLDEIGKLAGLLKKDKAVAAAPAAARYVAEMIGESQSVARDVAKSKAEHENAQKAKADAEKKVAAKTGGDDDDDEIESPELLTSKLKPLLKLVAKGETMHTLVAKSGKKVVVMMARKPIPPARRKMLADQLGGGTAKFYPGVCSLEAGATTFALKAEVAGLAKLVKLALLDQTGLRMKNVKCRGDDGDDHDVDDDDGGVVARSGDGAGGGVAGAVGATAASTAAAAAAATACVTPEATATDCFFDHDSANLTPSDKTFLEAYAKAYLGSKETRKILLEGFASVDGVKADNEKLSLKRAAQVAAYLVAQKVPRAQMDFIGKGPTKDFSPDNLCLNRRVTLKPAIELKVRDFVEVVENEPRNVPIPGKTPSVSLGEKAEYKDDFTIPEPPEMVSREVVREELRKWLLDLGKAQNHKARESDLTSTSRVYVAEQTLLGRTRGGIEVDRPAVTPENGDGRGWRAKDLADHIVNNLPEEIPKVNVVLFRKMSAQEAQAPKSTADQIRDKVDEKADDMLSDFHVPKKYWKDIKDAIRKRVPDLIDKLPADDAVKDAAKKVYDKLNKSEKSE